MKKLIFVFLLGTMSSIAQGADFICDSNSEPERGKLVRSIFAKKYLKAQEIIRAKPCLINTSLSGSNRTSLLLNAVWMNAPYEFVKFLLDNGANPLSENFQGRTPLFALAEKKHKTINDVKVAKLLIDSNSGTLLNNLRMQKTVFYELISTNSPIELLTYASRKARLHRVTPYENSLYMAVFSRFITPIDRNSLIKFLTSLNISINFEGPSPGTLLHVAFYEKWSGINIDFITFLIDNGLCLEHANKVLVQGRTVTELATKIGKSDSFIQEMLDLGIK